MRFQNFLAFSSFKALEGSEPLCFGMLSDSGLRPCSIGSLVEQHFSGRVLNDGAEGSQMMR